MIHNKTAKMHFSCSNGLRVTNNYAVDCRVLNLKCNNIDTHNSHAVYSCNVSCQLCSPQTLSKPREASDVPLSRRSPSVHCLPACRRCVSAADCSHRSPTAQTVQSSATPATINISLLQQCMTCS